MKEADYIRQWYNEAMHGNVSCFSNILTYYHAQLFSYALKICRQGTLAEDALQDAYLSCYVHFKEVRDPEHLFGWMLTIVRRSCWQQLNSEKTVLPLSSSRLGSKMIDESLENQIENNDMNAFLWERIGRLSEPLRIVVILRYFSMFNDYEYISRILGVPVGTVRSRLNEAKKQLKKIWDSNLGDMPYTIRREAEYWNDFYTTTFSRMQTDEQIRKNFSNHLLPELTIRFTNGELKQGRNLIEKELDDDLKFGTSYRINTVFNLNQIGIVQGENINSPEYPDRCPPLTTIIFYRNSDKSHHLNFHVG